MTNMGKQDEGAALVHWTYSREEWKTFVRWEKRNKGFFHYLLHRLLPSLNPKTPGVTITAGKVSINDKQEPFHDSGRRLQRIHIRDAGKMNVMEISYQQHGASKAGPKEIHIPVPKGRLKEAIDLEVKLNEIRSINP